MGYAFKSEESKDEFVKELQEAAKDLKTGSIVYSIFLKNKAQEYKTGNTLIDSSKDKIANYAINKYGDDLYKI